MNQRDIRHLFSLRNEYRTLRYDLRNTQILCQALGNPHQSFPLGPDCRNQRQGFCRTVVVGNDSGRRAVCVPLTWSG